MSNEPQTIVQFLDAWVTGPITTIFGALMGRYMWHSSEVKKGNRKLFGREVVWELPIAVGMGVIGEGVGAYFGLNHTVTTSLVAFMAYLGPRGAEALFSRWFDKQIGKD